MVAQPPNDAAGDDEMLGWDDETDPSHVDGPAAAPRPDARTSPRRTKAAAETVTEGATGAETEPGARPQASSILLVTYGILAGAFLLYVVGWIMVVGRSTVTLPSLLGEIMYQFGEFLAIASPAFWFAAVFILTRGRKPVVRLLWLLLGLVLLVPWPFVLGGA